MNKEKRITVEIPKELEEAFRLFVVLHGGAITEVRDISEDINRIVYDDRYESVDTTTLYFYGPKELLQRWVPNSDYPDAISMEISITFPGKRAEVSCVQVSVSPTRKVEGGTEDYDWHDIELPGEEIEKLIRMAEKKG